MNLKRVRRWYRLDGLQLRMRVPRRKYVPQADNHYGTNSEKGNRNNTAKYC